MSYEDARTLLNDVLHYEYTDSLLSVYMERDSLNREMLTLHTSVISKLTLKNDNWEQIANNLESKNKKKKLGNKRY
jgi:hypothetical protein